VTIPAWLIWVIVASYTIGAISNVALIGVPRKPITKGQAAFSVFCSCVVIVAAALWVTG
jgi:hypothetical protein